MAHAGKKPIFSALAARQFANSPMLGGRAEGIGLKLTKGEGEDTIITSFNLGLPAVEAGGSISTVCGVGRPGRISLGRFPRWPPTWQVSTAGIGGGGSCLNAFGRYGWLAGDRFHWGCLPRPPCERRLCEAVEPAMLVLPP